MPQAKEAQAQAQESSTQSETLTELAFRRREALKMGGSEAVERQHQAGRMTVRERIAALVDSGSFREIGTLAGTGKYDDTNRLASVTPAPYVAGLAKIDGRPVAVGGEDFTVRGGTTFGSTRRKGGQGGLVEDLAYHYRLPLVNLIDGAGGSVTSIKRRGHSVFPGIHGSSAQSSCWAVSLLCPLYWALRLVGRPAERSCRIFLLWYARPVRYLPPGLQL